MRVIILEWSGSPVGVTVGNTYSVNPGNHKQFIDDNCDVRPLSMAKHATARLVMEGSAFRVETSETIEMKMKRQIK